MRRARGVYCLNCEEFHVWDHKFECEVCGLYSCYTASAEAVMRRSRGIRGLLGEFDTIGYVNMQPAQPPLKTVVIRLAHGDNKIFENCYRLDWIEDSDPAAIASAGGGLLGGGNAVAMGIKAPPERSIWLAVITLLDREFVTAWQGYAVSAERVS